MSYGYSRRIVAMNEEASTDLIGVELGRHCIEKDIPVARIAETFKVSRMTVYNWFTGSTNPKPDVMKEIRRWLRRRASRK